MSHFLRPLTSRRRFAALSTLAVLVLTSAASAQILPGPVFPGPINPPIDPPIFPPPEIDPHVLGIPTFDRGDANDSGAVDISDATFILRFLFSGGEEPSCKKAADVDDDGAITVGDATGLLGYLYRGTRAPRPPFGSCGVDPTRDDLGCRISTRCGTTPTCPDPAVVELHVEVVHRDPRAPWSGLVRVAAVLENRGSLWESRRAAQGFVLRLGNEILRHEDFVHLETGQRITLVAALPWSAALEFPPSFVAEIGYDPDIAIDSLDSNDDCELDNNRREISGYSVSRMFD